MSYKKGFAAFIKRFQKAFPEPEYIWKVSVQQGDNTFLNIPNGIVFLCGEKGRYERVHVDVYHMNKLLWLENKIVSIWANLAFGIRLQVSSKYYEKGLYLHRRPRNLIFGNQHCMRLWLENKPNFAKEGAMLAAHIKQEFLKTNPS